MATIAEELALLPFFSRVARSDLERAAPRFRRVTLAPNEMLWAQGSAVDELALILYGELAASAGGESQDGGGARAAPSSGAAAVLEEGARACSTGVPAAASCWLRSSCRRAAAGRGRASAAYNDHRLGLCGARHGSEGSDCLWE